MIALRHSDACEAVQTSRSESMTSLGNDEKTWTGFPGSQAIAKIARHRASIMSDQNPFLLRCEFTKDRIMGPSQAGTLGV